MKPLQRRLLYGVLGLLFFSGSAWAYWNDVISLPGDFEVAAKAWAMKIHGAAAMAILVLIGMLLTGHVRSAWRARRNRGNGLLFLGAFGILTITGYLLYYAGAEDLRAWTSWVHLAVGLALPLFLIVHIWLGKRTRPAAQLKKHQAVGGENRHRLTSGISGCQSACDTASSPSRSGSLPLSGTRLWQKQQN